MRGLLPCSSATALNKLHTINNPTILWSINTTRTVAAFEIMLFTKETIMYSYYFFSLLVNTNFKMVFLEFISIQFKFNPQILMLNFRILLQQSPAGITKIIWYHFDHPEPNLREIVKNDFSEDIYWHRSRTISEI